MNLDRRFLNCALIFFLFLVFCLIATVCFSATLAVGAGQQFSSIQSAINSANSGDTVRVNNGTYHESIKITKSNITLISQNQWGAILDGNNKSIKRAIIVDASNNKIIGFRIQNYITANIVMTESSIYLGKNANYSEVKYCIFELTKL